MNTHSNIAFSRAATTITPHLSASPSMLLSELETQWQLNNSEVSYKNSTINKSCSNGYNSSYCSGSPSSVVSHGLKQRILSSHNSSAFFAELLESEEGPVRRVYSTGDLRRMNRMQHNHHSDTALSSECSIIIEGMSRTSPYSPEEKKVRIERYRSKRNQRNFNKKIKYACRKTLADRRPRIRGRFVRNEEIDKNPLVQWSHIGAEEEEEGEEDEKYWVRIFDSLVAANLAKESQVRSSFGLLY